MFAVPKKAQFCPSVDHEVLDIARRVVRAQATLVTFRPARASNDSERGNTRQCVTIESSGGDAAPLRRTNQLRTRPADAANTDRKPASNSASADFRP